MHAACQRDSAIQLRERIFDGAEAMPSFEEVAALPPPVQTDLSDAGDEGTVGQGQVVAQEAPQGGSKERPPWWWILSAVVMLGLVL